MRGPLTLNSCSQVRPKSSQNVNTFRLIDTLVSTVLTDIYCMEKHTKSEPKNECRLLSSIRRSQKTTEKHTNLCDKLLHSIYRVLLLIIHKIRNRHWETPTWEFPWCYIWWAGGLSFSVRQCGVWQICGDTKQKGFVLLHLNEEKFLILPYVSS